MHYLNEQNIFIFLIQVFLLLGLARGVGEIFRSWKQPPLTDEILVGVFLGPTIFGRFLPRLHQMLFPVNAIQQNMLETVAWLGVLFLLLETGLEIDFSSAWRQRGGCTEDSIGGYYNSSCAVTFTQKDRCCFWKIYFRHRKESHDI